MSHAKLLRALQAFRSIYDLIPSQTIEAFLYIAENGRVTKSELERALHISKTGAYHNLALLSEHSRRGGRRSLGLIKVRPDPAERRRNIYELTARGQRLSEQIRYIMEE